MDLKVGDLVRRYKFDCVEGPCAPLVGIIIRIVVEAPYHRMIHVLFGDRIRRYSETYGAETTLKVISEIHREQETMQKV